MPALPMAPQRFEAEAVFAFSTSLKIGRRFVGRATPRTHLSGPGIEIFCDGDKKFACSSIDLTPPGIGAILAGSFGLQHPRPGERWRVPLHSVNAAGTHAPKHVPIAIVGGKSAAQIRDKIRCFP